MSHEGEQREKEGKVFALRTMLGREFDVAAIIAMRAEDMKQRGVDVDIKSVVIPPGIRGYVFIEAGSLSDVFKVTGEIKYLRATRPVPTSMADLERLLKPKMEIKELKEGDEVEIVKGPFRGMRAKITSIDRNKNMLTVNILEASFTIPITIPGDYVKKVERAE